MRIQNDNGIILKTTIIENIPSGMKHEGLIQFHDHDFYSPRNRSVDTISIDFRDSFEFPLSKASVSRFLYREADSTKKEATRLTTGYWHGSMLPVPWQTSAFDFCIGGQVAAEASATGYFRFFTFPSDLHSKLFHDRKFDNKSERKENDFS